MTVLYVMHFSQQHTWYHRRCVIWLCMWMRYFHESYTRGWNVRGFCGRKVQQFCLHDLSESSHKH